MRDFREAGKFQDHYRSRVARFLDHEPGSAIGAGSENPLRLARVGLVNVDRGFTDATTQVRKAMGLEECVFQREGLGSCRVLIHGSVFQPEVRPVNPNLNIGVGICTSELGVICVMGSRWPSSSGGLTRFDKIVTLPSKIFPMFSSGLEES
jgi:hypothetical protein